MLAENSLGDILINTPVYGIHNPDNYHSFTATSYIFLPMPCYICEQTVYPFVSACICLRCRCFVHRSCCRKKSKCEYFTFKNSNSSANLNAQNQQNISIRNMFDLENIIEKARNVPKMLNFLPVPGEFSDFRFHFHTFISTYVSITSRQRILYLAFNSPCCSSSSHCTESHHR